MLQKRIRIQGLGLVTAAMSALFVAIPAVTSAEEVVGTPENLGKRIAIAGRQRMLAEGMAKEVCYIDAGVDTTESLRELYVMWNVYGWYHRGIYLGNAQLDLFEEKNERIKRMWIEVDQVWDGIAPKYNSIMENEVVANGDFDQVMQITDKLSFLNNDLVSLLGSVYAGDINDAGHGSALLINLYERERMLSQKLSKEACLIQHGYQSDATRARFVETRDNFTVSMNALINGMESVSVPAAPTSEIRDQLLKAQSHWNNVQGLADLVAKGGGLNREQMSTFRQEMNEVVGELTIAIAMLVQYEASKA